MYQYTLKSPFLHAPLQVGEMSIIYIKQVFFFFSFYFIHMYIQCLGHFSPPQPPPYPLTPHYPAETIFPLSLILL
jgi:hypothetical protein